MPVMTKTVMVVFAVLILALLFAPREPIDGPLAFDPRDIGPDIDAYLDAREARYDDLVKTARARVVWADPATKAPTPLSIVYLHGFSASAEEIRPVPDMVAEALGANFFYTRLAGHGRSGAAMAEPRVTDWRSDLAEAMEIGRRIGERVVVIATSTGATLATILADDPRMNADLAGIAMVSPNFKLQSASGRVLRLPFARQIAPVFAGRTYDFTPSNEAHAAGWTESYPTSALVTMAAAMRAANGVNFAAQDIPIMMFFAVDDQVVDHERSVEVARLWGGAADIREVTLGPGDDPARHVVAGDVLSPGQTQVVARQMISWISDRL